VGKTLADVVRDLGRSERLRAALVLPDEQLLERFAHLRDEAAFEALLHRHGPLVFGVCRKLLYDAHDAEDAFQATFLILARKASSVAPRSLVGNWLYGVAYRVAARARKAALRRPRQQLAVEVAAVPGTDRTADPDLAPLLHEELQRLPEKYRRPVVLCHLEGKTNEEAATRLRCPVGTVKIRLHRARALLRARLTRRGVTLSAGLLTSALAPSAVSAGLLDASAEAALTFAAGGAVSASVAALTKGVLQTMLLNKLKLGAALILAVAVLVGAGGFVFRTPATETADKQEDKPNKQEDKPKLAAEDPAKEAPAKDDKDAIQGVWKLTGIRVAPGTASGGLLIEKWVILADRILESFHESTLEHKVGYKLDSTAKPKTLDLIYPGKNRTQLGIYELDGDTLKVCVPYGNPERPTKMGPSDSSMVYIFQREPPPGAAKEPKKPADDKEPKKPADDKEALQGTWKVRQLIMNGVEASNVTDTVGSASPRGAKWVFEGDKLVRRRIFEEGSEEFSFKLDPAKSPKAIDLVDPKREKEKSYLGFEKPKDYTQRGIYLLDGDTLKVCLGLESDRPKEFSSGVGDKTLLFVLRREPPEDKDKLRGAWKVIEIRADGKGVTNEAGEPRLFAQAQWVVTAGKLEVRAPEKTFAFKFTLEPGAKPKAIDLTLTDGPEDEKGKTRACAYSLEEDTLKLCLPFEAGAERPITVAAEKGDKALLIVLRRQPEDEK
jgi:RNA polymerase sigma factor (sigma-70 family)